MAVSATWYGQALVGQWGTTAARRVDWGSDTIKCLLATSSYTPDVDAHDFLADITGEVANGNGYTTGGETLASKTGPTYTSGTNTLALDAADITWTFTASKTARYAVIYKDTGASATSPLMGYVDFGSDQTSSGTFKITWAAGGIFTVTAS